MLPPGVRNWQLFPHIDQAICLVGPPAFSAYQPFRRAHFVLHLQLAPALVEVESLPASNLFVYPISRHNFALRKCILGEKIIT